MNFIQYQSRLTKTIKSALQEDIRNGDITSKAIFDKIQTTKAHLIAKQDCTIAGLWVFEKTFKMLDQNLKVTLNAIDGDSIKSGKKVAEISGSIQSILSAERVSLNFLQRMSGIATLTRSFVNEISGSKAGILDTRKTAPGLRLFDKWAVQLGGGFNHRIGLYDVVMIKDNHIAGAGSIKKAIELVRKKVSARIKIVVEVKNLNELKECLPLKVDQIMLDNMNLAEMRIAVAETAGQIKLEASGNVTLKNVRKIAETGVDYISIGYLTHSVKAADLSLLIF